MNWLHFLLWVGGFYALYYLAVILFDVAGARRPGATDGQGHELTFNEHVAPLQMSAPETGAETSGTSSLAGEVTIDRKPEMIGSGGVVIDNLFKLCKQEAVIYTRSVSF